MYKETSMSQQQVFDVVLNNSNSHQNGRAGLSCMSELTCTILLSQKVRCTPALYSSLYRA